MSKIGNDYVYLKHMNHNCLHIVLNKYLFVLMLNDFGTHERILVLSLEWIYLIISVLLILTDQHKNFLFYLFTLIYFTITETKTEIIIK